MPALQGAPALQARWPDRALEWMAGQFVPQLGSKVHDDSDT